MKKPVIEVKNITKTYNISHEILKNSHPTIKDEFVRIMKKPLQWIGAAGAYDKEKFNALNDVSFVVNAGDVVGIMGTNGSGKSTLFKILSRITQPSSGEAIMEGRVASLLEVGTGFNPELTGKENVFLNGSILGMKKKEIEKNFDEIVGFSEIGKFIDTPVKYYSSGMKVRLAFAVAASLDTDILIIDEVLAVGDLRFKQKSIDRMKEIASSGKTILFVSHIISQIQELCTRGLVLKEGGIIFDGDIDEAIEIYEELNEEIITEEEVAQGAVLADQNSGNISIQDIYIKCSADDGTPSLSVSFDILNPDGYETEKAWVGIIIASSSNANLSLIDSEVSKSYIKLSSRSKKTHVSIEIPDLNLYPDKYKIKLGLRDDLSNELVLQRIEKAGSFTVGSYTMKNGFRARKRGPRPAVLYDSNITFKP
jgi:ABC-type polysaccharide/polyol phosphate transport system ATPase subunit